MTLHPALRDLLREDSGPSWFEDEYRNILKQNKKKAELLSRPDLMDKKVRPLVDAFSFSPSKVRSKGFESVTASLEARDKGTPQEGFATELRGNLAAALQSPKYRRMSVDETLNSLSVEIMAKPDEEGSSRIEKGYIYKRLADTAWFGDVVKKPRGYDQWLEDVEREEEKELAKKDWLAGPADIGLVAGGGAAIGAAFGAAPGAAVGAISGAAIEAIAHPIRRAIHGTKWGRARMHSNSAVEAAKVMGLEFGLEVVGGIKIDRMLMRALTIPRTMASAAYAKPSAANLLKYKESKRSAKDAIKLITSQQKLQKDLFKKRDFKTFGQKAFSQLEDSEAIETALTHPGGIEVGSVVALSEQKAIRIATDPREPKRILDKIVREQQDLVKKEGPSNVVRDILAMTSRTKPLKGYPEGTRITSYKEIYKDIAEGKAKEKAAAALVEEKRLISDATDFLRLRGVVHDLGDIRARGLAEVGEDEVERIAVDAAEIAVDKEADKVIKSTSRVLSRETEGGPILSDSEYDTLLKKYKEELRPKKEEVAVKEKVLSKEQRASRQADLDIADVEDARWKSGLLGLAILGGTASMLTFFLSPPTAEASPVTTVVKGAAKVLAKKKESALKAMAAKSYIVPDLKPNQMLVTNFQRGLEDTVAGGPASILKDMNRHIKNPSASILNYISPYQAEQAVLRGGEGKMISAAVFNASYTSAEYRNINLVLEAMDNAFKEAGVKTAYRNVTKATRSLLPLAEEQMLFDFHTASRKYLGTKLKRLVKRKGLDEVAKADEIDLYKKKIGWHSEEMKKFEGTVGTYHSEHLKVMEGLAEEFPSVRIALALDDTSDFVRYSFLKGKLTYSEKVAVGRVREQLLQYQGRLENMKEAVIKGPYLPHVHHPEMADILTKYYGSSSPDAAAFMKMYSRGLNSRPLLPDIHATLEAYIPDIERRIQTQKFWGKGKDSWTAVMNHPVVQGHPTLRAAFQQLQNGTAPQAKTTSNEIAKRYIQFEVFNRLFLNPSAGLKHFIKMSGDIASAGGVTTVKAVPAVAKGVTRRLYNALPKKGKGLLSKAGYKTPESQQSLFDSYYKSAVHQRTTRQVLLDMGINDPKAILSTMDTVWGKTLNVGGAWINLAELVDRGFSIETALTMATRKGMTIEQSLYGAYDMIIKNNFLSRQFNPGWVNNPKIRALFMFQRTPYMILERRAIAAYKTYKTIKGMGKGIFNATKTEAGRKKLLYDLRNIRRAAKEGEHAFKQNLYIDAWKQETDFFGTPIASQFVRELALIGLATYAGSKVGLNLYHHFFHLPFLSGMHDEPTLAFSPGPMALKRGWDAWQEREEGDTEFLSTKIWQKWLGSSGPLPDTFWKLHRITESDIPEIYKGSHLQYLFAIPAKHR